MNPAAIESENHGETVMIRVSPSDTEKGNAWMPAGTHMSRSKAICTRLAFAACLVLLPGCTPTSTIVEHVWRDSTRPTHAPLGKTLVVALFSDADVVIPIENEWRRQLEGRGIDVEAFDALMPGTAPRDKQTIVELVKARGFDTVLVSKLVGVKQVDRDVSAYQVAVVETELYDARTEQPFWKAESDTFLVNPGGSQGPNPRSELIRDFVETMIEQMSESKVL